MPIRLDDSTADFESAFRDLLSAKREVSEEVEAWWRSFQSGDAETRKAMLLPQTEPAKRRRRRRRKRPAGAAAESAPQS